MRVKIAITLLLATLPSVLFCQYYDQGQSPASIKWNVLKKSTGDIVYSSQYQHKALQVSRLLDTLRPVIGYSFRYGPMKVPVLMHSQNFASNGLVILAPKRMELVTIPDINSYSEPWLKQLTAHEMRHAVQYNNLNRNFVKALGYIIGEQAPLAATALMPIWFMEGDATMAETQLSTYGRGLQPQFTIEYRYYADINQKFPLDKWFCGSYKNKIPDHYQLGYQIVSYAYDHYGENPWDKVMNYTSKYPFLLFTSKIALHKYYRTSVNKLSRATLADLYSFWQSQPRVENSATIIDTKTTAYTTYSTPTPINDTTIVAVKKDLDNPSRVVLINPKTASEKVLAHIGNISTPPVYSNGTLYWTEYRSSTLWEQRVNSVLCEMNVSTATKNTIRSARQVLYPAPMKNNLAVVEYDYSGKYTIKHRWGALTLPDTISVHGLAYDNLSDCLYFIALSDKGMWIGSTPSNLSEFSQVTKPAHITINNLRAANQRLYYNSIASGKDEAHLFDLSSGKEYRISTSTFGSFAPTPNEADNQVYMTTYNSCGYMVSHQTMDSLIEVTPARTPINTINPPRKGWDIALNLDSVDVSTPSANEPSPKRYRKGLHLFKGHSWAPLYINPDNIIDDIQFKNTLIGATIMSQNLLGSMQTTLSYGYTDKGSIWRAKMGYYGLPVKIEAEVLYGGGNRPEDPIQDVALPPSKKYLGIAGRLSIPINFSSGYHLKMLTPSIDFTHDNSVIIDNMMTGYREGRDLVKTQIQYVDNVAMAYKNFLPRYGYAIKISNILSPTSNSFSKLWSIYARGFLPGVARNHSLKLEVAAETQKVNHTVGSFKYNFSPISLRIDALTTTIVASKYGAARASYQLPVWYPDGGISSILYLKRVRLQGVVSAARYNDIWASRWRDAFSYGAEIFFDITPLRMPSNINAIFSISVFKPSDRDGVVVGTNISIPL